MGGVTRVRSLYFSSLLSFFVFVFLLLALQMATTTPSSAIMTMATAAKGLVCRQHGILVENMGLIAWIQGS